MNLNYYMVFAKVAETENLSKAGQELYLSQPAISQMMHQLEQELDCKLFVRKSKGIALTMEGKEFYTYVKIGIQALEKASYRIKEMKKLEYGTLRLGVSDTISRYILPERLKIFSNRYPHLHIQIQNGTTGELEHMIKNEEIDIVLGFQPNRCDTIIFYPLMTLHEAFVTSKSYAKQLPKQLTMQNLYQAKIMMLDSKSQTRRKIDAQLLLQNIVLSPEVELANYELLAEFAKQGLGVAILAKELIEDLCVLETNIELPVREVGFYHQAKVPLSFAAKAFIEMMKTM